MKVTIGIPTYNRLELLEIMAKSLYASDLSQEPNIRIYDDCSSDYSLGFLERAFPTAAAIQVNPGNIKADKNMYHMYTDFLASGDDYFFNADSDIIFNKQWLNHALELIDKTDGVLSLFNSNAHKPYSVIDDTFCLKKTIGAAGTLFSRQRVIELIAHFDSIEKVRNFDWQWCHYFENKGVFIYCVNNSLVQHIGYYGQNSRLYFDVGKHYKVQSIAEGQTINDIFEKSMDAIRFKEQERIREFSKAHAAQANNFNYHFKRCMVIIIKKVLPTSLYTSLKKYINPKPV